MHTLIDLETYPLDQPESPMWKELVAACQAELDENGMFNLPDLMRPSALAQAITELRPILETQAFVHAREHNIYFKPSLPDLPEDHPALRRFETSNRTICADQFGQNLIMQLYQWPLFITFLARVMGKPALYTMEDPLARVNVMGYGAGQALNWHFDRSEFTTTLLLQAPDIGGEFEYCKDLRSDTDPNYDGVADLLNGDRQTVITPVDAGTLNVFRGKNTAHRVTPVQGNKDRIIAVFSYYETQGVLFSEDERVAFYGRAS